MKKEAEVLDPFILHHGANHVWYGIFPAFARMGIKHGISTRLGGVSNHPFATLNLGLHTGDSAADVVCNRERFCQAVGVDFEKVVTAEQVHGDQISVVGLAEAGRGARIYEQALPGTDGLVTNCKGLPLMLFFADCVPVLIVDPVRGVVGISHAGWKGTTAQIASKTVITMQEHFGTIPADCLAAIGPSIGPCCYEVDEVVINKLKARFPQWQQFVTPRNDKWMLNLWEANRQQLLESGVQAENVSISNICTACNTGVFFSHREEKGHTGRIGAIITL